MFGASAEKADLQSSVPIIRVFNGNPLLELVLQVLADGVSEEET